MGVLSVAGAAVGVGAATTLAVAVTQGDAGANLDIWALVEKGGAPMAMVLLIALIEVVRRHDRAYKIIEGKDATILEMSNRQVKAIETANDIANDQLTIARDTQALLKELVILRRGKPDMD